MRLTIFGVAGLLAASTSCGKLADLDAGTSFDAQAADASSSSPNRQTCRGGGGVVLDAAPGTPMTITCPVDWHCDHDTTDNPESVCCPPGHSDHPTYDPACAYCQCIFTCCPAGFSCASWDAAAPVCDGGM